MEQNETTTAVTVRSTDLCNKNVNLSKIIKNQADSSDYVAHLSPGDVKLMCIVAAKPAKITPKAKQDGPTDGGINPADIRWLFKSFRGTCSSNDRY